MKPFAQTSFLLLAAALLAAGCSRQPARPVPSQTVLGPQGGGSGGLSGSNIPTQVGEGLTARPAGGFDENGMMKGEVVGLMPIYFDFDQSAIKPSERAKLQLVAKYLQEHPNHRIIFEGRCDWRGTAEYNLALGDRRAAAAKQFVGTIGVAADRTETLSKGSLDAPKNASEEQMAKDRCVNVLIVQR